MRKLVVTLLLTAIAGTAQTTQPDAKQLLGEHRYLELFQAAHTQNSVFYKAVSAAIFNEPSAENLLKQVIQESPNSEEAYQAYDWLSNLYLRTGRYQSLMTTMDARWAAFPNKKDVAGEKKTFAPFRGLPDQRLLSRRVSTLRHKPNSLSIHFTINNRPAKFFLDNGSDLSCISLNEARHLGMEIHDVTGSMGTMTRSANFRTAVAHDLVIGNLHFKDVSFAVLPDDQEPMSLAPLEERGILGLPLIVAAQTLHWRADGTLTLGEKPQPLVPEQSNLFFDENHVVLKIQFQGQHILTAIDTGAEGTDVYAAFAHRFADHLSKVGTYGKNVIHGVGGTETYKSIEVPELTFKAGGEDVTLHPAHVYTEHQEKRSWIFANFGKDLLMQSSGFIVDFNAMKLTLEPPAKAVAKTSQP
jgi:hypothetical protein